MKPFSIRILVEWLFSFLMNLERRRASRENMGIAKTT